jgi:hypothetical protein
MKIIIPKEDEILHCQACDTRFSFNPDEDAEWEWAYSVNKDALVRRSYVACPICGIKHILNDWMEEKEL